MTKITHAPQDIIDELETLRVDEGINGVYQLFADGGIMDANSFGDSSIVDKWVYEACDSDLMKNREGTVINHVFGGERLQPERETRFYVNKEGGRIQLGIDDVPELLSGHQMLEYEFGMTEKQARGYAELFGGEIKEIK